MTRAAPTETPTDVLDRVLDKGIVAGASLRSNGAPIDLTGSAGQLVAESDVYVESAEIQAPRAA